MTEPLYQRDVTWRARYRAFLHAGRGVRILLATQWNARLHLAAAAITIGLGLFLGLEAGEWCLVILAIAAVWVTEALNTAVEFVIDLISPQHHRLAGQAKDLAAGAVLAASLAALCVGLILFIPKLWMLWLEADARAAF